MAFETLFRSEEETEFLGQVRAQTEFGHEETSRRTWGRSGAQDRSKFFGRDFAWQDAERLVALLGAAIRFPAVFDATEMHRMDGAMG